MESFQHKLEKFDIGVVWLDARNRVIALNGVAQDVLSVKVGEAIGEEITQFHPERSRDKVKWLLESAACPADAPLPMTMMINIPDRVLLIKVCKMFGADAGAGTCMVFYDLTDVITSPRREPEEQDSLRLLFKLPVYKRNKVVLVDLEHVIHLKSEGHYTDVSTRDENYLCNLSLSDLEGRLDPREFVRVHRSHMVNIRYALEFQRVDENFALVMDTAGRVRVPVSRSNVQKLKGILGLG